MAGSAILLSLAVCAECTCRPLQILKPPCNGFQRTTKPPPKLAKAKSPFPLANPSAKPGGCPSVQSSAGIKRKNAVQESTTSALSGLTSNKLHTNQEVTAETLKWLDKAAKAGRPFFCWAAIHIRPTQPQNILKWLWRKAAQRKTSPAPKCSIGFESCRWLS